MSDQGLKDLEASVAAHANLELLEAENKRLRELLSRVQPHLDSRDPLNNEIDAALGEQERK